MAQTIANELEGEGGFLVEVQDDGNVYIESAKGESATLTPQQVEKALEVADSQDEAAEEVVSLGDGLAVTQDTSYSGHHVAIGYEGMEVEETFLGTRLTEHVCSFPRDVWVDAVDATQEDALTVSA